MLVMWCGGVEWGEARRARAPSRRKILYLGSCGLPKSVSEELEKKQKWRERWRLKEFKGKSEKNMAEITVEQDMASKKQLNFERNW